MQKELFFSITGEFITNHFRQLCLEEKYDKAINGLKDSLIGISLDIVISVLKGDKRFSGTDEVFLEDETDFSYKEELLKKFSSYFFYENQFYKVVSRINTIKKGENYILHRARLYDPKLDNYIFHENELYTLHKVKEPPFWLIEDIKKNQKIEAPITYGVDMSQVELEQNQRDILLSIIDLQIERNLLCSPEDKEYLIEENFFYEELYYRNMIAEKLEIQMVENLRQKVIKQAEQNGGFIIMKSEQGKIYRVPKNPFLIWASGHSISNLKADNVNWEPVFPQGFKLRSDNPYHTDFVMGSGVQPFEAYRSDFSSVIYNALYSVLPGDIIVISGKGIIKGSVHKVFNDSNIELYRDKIISIPYAGVEFFEIAKIAKLVIAAEGGPASHLALNAEEYNINLIYMEEALGLSDSIEYTFDLDNESVFIEEKE